MLEILTESTKHSVASERLISPLGQYYSNNVNIISSSKESVGGKAAGKELELRNTRNKRP